MTNLSQHLSRELKDLIKTIGETKSKQEEDRLIIQEMITLKPKLLQKNIPVKVLKEHLIRALYIQMLGHNASFAHIHAINLTQNKNLILKRIGYLMCSLFFNSNSELLIMLVSTILKDLISNDIHEIVICLTSLGNIINSTIASAVSESVFKLINHSTDLVRKKAILVMQKIKVITSSEIPDYKQKMKKALCDREPSVMAASLTLYIEEIKENPKKYRDLASSFVIILKQVIEHKLPKEFDYHRTPAPWIQIKLLKIIELLGKGDQKASEHAYAILEQTLKRAEETNNNIALAVAYQAMRTISVIYPNASLAHEASIVLSKFLEPRSSNNMKYMGISVLAHLYKQNPSLLQEYQLTIVDCLESKDETLKKETLDLLYKVTSKDNVEVIVSKMLNSLHASTDHHFRNELVIKITELAERFSTTHYWYLETMQLLFQLGSQYLSEDVLNNFLKLVMEKCAEDDSFGLEIIQRMKALLEKVAPTDFVLQISTYIIGEIGSGLKDASILTDLAKVVAWCLERDYAKESQKVYAIDALIKLSSSPLFQNHNDVKLILEKYSKHPNIELSQRCLESKKLAKYNAALRQSSSVNFEDDLPFLNPYVENAIRGGAKTYSRAKTVQPVQQTLKLAYEAKVTPSPFPLGNLVKEEELTEVVAIKPQMPSIKTTMDFYQQKPIETKKQFVTPEQRQKMNLAKNLFGQQPKPAKPNPPASKAPQIKKTKFEESKDLI